LRGRWIRRERFGLVFEALGAKMWAGDEDLGLKVGRG
jgi:hypothetical protein